MCDYSQESLRSEKAKARKVYKADVNTGWHGFMTKDSHSQLVTAVCVVHGQKLVLREVVIRKVAILNYFRGFAHTHKEAVVTVVQRERAPARKYPDAYHGCNDWLEFPCGTLIPVAAVQSCTMKLQAKPRKRNLVKVLGLDQPDTTVTERETEKV